MEPIGLEPSTSCMPCESHPPKNQTDDSNNVDQAPSVTPHKMSLSGLVPGILTKWLALRTRAPCCEEGEEVGDVDIAITVEVRGVAGI